MRAISEESSVDCCNLPCRASRGWLGVVQGLPLIVALARSMFALWMGARVSMLGSCAGGRDAYCEMGQRLLRSIMWMNPESLRTTKALALWASMCKMMACRELYRMAPAGLPIIMHVPGITGLTLRWKMQVGVGRLLAALRLGACIG